MLEEVFDYIFFLNISMAPKCTGLCFVTQNALPSSALIPFLWEIFPITGGNFRFPFYIFFSLRDSGCSFTKRHVNNQFLFSYAEDIHLLLRLYLFAVWTNINILSLFHIHTLFIAYAFIFLLYLHIYLSQISTLQFRLFSPATLPQ